MCFDSSNMQHEKHKRCNIKLYGFQYPAVIKEILNVISMVSAVKETGTLYESRREIFKARWKLPHHHRIHVTIYGTVTADSKPELRDSMPAAKASKRFELDDKFSASNLLTSNFSYATASAEKKSFDEIPLAGSR